MATQIQRLRCDGCGRSTYLDNLIPVRGEALCLECAPGAQPPRRYEREAQQYGSPVYVLTCDLDYVPPKEQAEREPTEEERADVDRLPMEALAWWAAQPSCYAYPKLAALVAEKLAAAGLTMPERSIREPTRAAKVVTAYWKDR